MVGRFDWGPCFERTAITNNRDLVSKFGKPNDNNYEHFYSAWNNLQYNDKLFVVRAVDATTALNAGLEIHTDVSDTAASAVTEYIPNYDATETVTLSFTGTAVAQVFAKYPSSTFSSTIKVAIANADDFATANIMTGTTFADNFDYDPSDSNNDFDFAVAVLIPNDAGEDEIVEKFLVSQTPGTQDYEGNNIYFEEYINRKSAYIYMFDNTSVTGAVNSMEATALTGGNEGAPSESDAFLGFDLYANPEEFDVNIVIDGGWVSSTAGQYIIDNIAEVRKDCVAVLGVPKTEIVNVADISTAVSNAITYRKDTLSRASSYAAIYPQYKYQLDKYNDKYRWVPITGDVAGVYAKTDYLRDPWFAPAGFNRGQIKNVVKFAINPTKGYRDLMYKDQLNPVVNFPGDGPVIFGQKTLQVKPSAFDRIDVRRLFIVLEKAISTASKYFLFEKNTAFTRNRIVGMIDPFLRDVKGREGLYDFAVVCDESNNTGEVIDRNELACDIYLKPTRTAEFIVLTFVATKTGVEFSELLKKS